MSGDSESLSSFFLLNKENVMPSLSLSPMTLGDVFDRLFKLIGKTWLRNLTVAIIILGPAALIMAIVADSAFSELAAMMQDRRYGSTLSPTDITSLLGFALWFAIGLTLMIIGSVIATVAITIVACAEMSGESLSWQEALSRSFHTRVMKVIGQYILEGLLLGAIVIIPYALLIVGIATDSGALGFFGGFLLLIAVLAAVYLGISFAFTVPAISWEDADIIESFKRSWSLVRGRWWRTFGILVLMSLMVSFALSIIMTPLYMVVFWDFFKAYFEVIAGMSEGRNDPSLVVNMIQSLGFGVGIVSGISSILQMIITPLYTVVMYFDLRARHGEFSQSPSTVGIP